MIEEEAFEETRLKELVIRRSLQYIGGRMCPSTTALLLTRESRIPKFEKWKAAFMINRNEVMGTRKRHEGEDEEDGKEGECGKDEEDGKDGEGGKDEEDGENKEDGKDKGDRRDREGRKDGKVGKPKSSKCCALL
jgi:hypothetical protein